VAVFEFRVPDVGEGIAEAELVEWFVAVGDVVSCDQPVAEVMTDKANVELPSPVAGVVEWLGAAAGDRIAVGAALVRLRTDETGVGEEADGTAATAGGGAARRAGDGAAAGSRGGQPQALAPPSWEPTPIAAGSAAPIGRHPLASPALRRRARDAGVDLSLVSGSGPDGRITQQDLEDHMKGIRKAPARPAPAAGGERGSFTEIPMTGLRRTISDRLSKAKARIPHFTYVEEVDVTETERLRHALNAESTSGRPKLTLLAFVTRALVQAIGTHPGLNAHYDDEGAVVRQHAGIHIGIAVQTPRGLVVPVLHDAGLRDIWGCAADLERLAAGAREGVLRPEDVAGSTITISSLGALGGIVTTPIINYPEVAIIGVNRMATRPQWDGSGFVPRQMMNVSCGFDHRVVDGWDGAQFVQTIKALLEVPALMFVDGR
jgi:2-oxoisovalerate dehydrogenase E2 component (dihydrolipoyl transacylase)